MISCSPAERRYICEKSFKAFALYHFTEYFTYALADFHHEMFKDLEWQDDEGTYKFLVWLMFRESAKTSITKMYIVWLICHKKRRFINYDCYDKKNAEAALFDVAIALQTKQTLIEDYGQLFYDERKESSQKKSIGEFVTVNDIKVKAFSTQEPTRGRIYKQFRPDFIVMDDFENVKTADSELRTLTVLSHIREMRGGIASYAKIIFLGNYIADDGSVAYILREAKNNKSYRVRNVPIYKGEELTGKISWPGKHVWTDLEADLINRSIRDEKKKKVSIESLRRDNKDNFDPEFLNRPRTAGQPYFTVHSEPVEPLARYKEWRFYSDPIDNNKYACGADTSLGIGEDSNTAVTIDFTYMDPITRKIKPRVVAVYDNNLIGPDRFGEGPLTYIGKKFKGMLIAPEANNSGWACIVGLKKHHSNIYTRKEKDEIMDSDTSTLGFLTTQATRPEILSNLRTALELDLIDLCDEKLIEECLTFTRKEARKSGTTTTKHFDLVMALAIAWEMRHYATPCAIYDEVQKPVAFDPYSVV